MYLSEFKMFCKLIFMRKNYIEMSISGSQLHNKDWSAEQWQQYEISRWKLTLNQVLLLSCQAAWGLMWAN